LLPALVPCRDAEQQAAFVAARVLELRDEGAPLSESAVLYRSHYHSLELQLELTRRGIRMRFAAVYASSSRRTSKTRSPICASSPTLTTN
jgi:superfamily I DNA/RNA helicase